MPWVFGAPRSGTVPVTVSVRGIKERAVDVEALIEQARCSLVALQLDKAVKMYLRWYLLSCLIALAFVVQDITPAQGEWMLSSLNKNSVREVEPMATFEIPMAPTVGSAAEGVIGDGVIGICPVSLVLPMTTCFCNAIFTGVISVTSAPQLTRDGCVSFVGDERTILNGGGFCIPFLTLNRTLNAELLVGTLNQVILTTCLTPPSPISPIKLSYT